MEEPASGRTPSGALHGQDVYWQLLEEIRAGHLAPGARLTETELASRLSVSRTPVREAIRRLEADGLVTHEPRVGAMVRRLDYTEVMELYEMRSVLEGAAAKMAARSASAVEIEELSAINEDLAQATDDPVRSAALNQRFHLALMDAARNRYLVRSVQGVHRNLLILGPTTLEEAGRAKAAVAEHSEILDAIAARDGASAEAAMRRHMDAAQRVRLRQMRAAGNNRLRTKE
jgi:DNA-binding GntR family transcriptional regulator